MASARTIRRAVVYGGAILCIGLAACQTAARGADDGSGSAFHVVTADIQAGIEKHIEDQTAAGGGYFRFSSGDKDLSLKLVRVHTEYLANLGPRRHFACVDLVDTRGDVYDVDFFLEGDPGAMTVTETTLHKINGRPYYHWEQKPDGTWHRVTTDEVPEELLGLVRGQDEFEFIYRATLPEMSGSARMWLPVATSDGFQTVHILSIKAPGDYRMLDEPEHGNKILYMELEPEDGGERVEVRYRVRRKEKAAYEAEDDPSAHLRPERLVPADDEFRRRAAEITEGKKTDLVRARAIYDYVIDDMRYAKYSVGWGQGNAVYACNAKHGNCTDYHAYFIALARAAGIPARFAIGAAIPSNRDEGGVDGYHCWVEFYADGKWWPVDISEADKYSSLATYYFGHHPANRFELSRGRDLVVEPGPVSGPINFLAYPVLEVGGEPAKTKILFAFNRLPS
jgi:transglutaminase-like putative cysteine protease